MQTPADHSAGEDSTLFLAGHTAPAGTYRLVGTGREVRLDQEDVLPATGDGRVAVYVRQPRIWAEQRLSQEGVSIMHPAPVFCGQCVQAGVNALADYVYQPEETTLAGPMMGDPDYWPPGVNGQQSLCQEHYARLPADSRLDYVPAEAHKGPSGERGRTPR